MKLWKFHVTMSRKTGEIYMSRWQLLKTRLLCIYVNEIRLPDEDPWLHTHPWRKSWSFKLRGSYTEEVSKKDAKQLPGAYRYQVIEGDYGAGWIESRVVYDAYRRRPGRFSRIPEEHRIIKLHGGKSVWTLFIGWRSDRPWGFVNPETREVVGWRERAKQREMPLTAFSGGNQK